MWRWGSPGGELALEFRRTLGMDQRVTQLDSDDPQANHEWASDLMLGQRLGDTNLASRVVLTDNPAAEEEGDPPVHRGGGGG